MWAFLKAVFRKDTTPVILEYLSDYGSGSFIVKSIDGKTILNTFQEDAARKMKSWIKTNGYHIAKRIDTFI